MNKLKLAIFSSAVFILLVSTLWLQQGCVGGPAPFAAMIVTSTPTLPPDYVSDFETGGVSINPNLLNVNGHAGSFTSNKYLGGNFATTPTPNITITPGFTPTVTWVTIVQPQNNLNSPIVVPNTITNSVNGSPYALHLFASLYTTPNNYEADQLFCNFLSGASSPYYDLTPFTAVRMDVAFGGDTNSNRALAFPIDLTTPSSAAAGGNCTSSCYAHYQVPLPGGQNTGWMPVTYTWSQFVQTFGSLGTPFSSHLNKVIQLSVSLGANTASGGVSTYTDFWIDNVKFLP